MRGQAGSNEVMMSPLLLTQRTSVMHVVPRSVVMYLPQSLSQLPVACAGSC